MKIVLGISLFFSLCVVIYLLVALKRLSSMPGTWVETTLTLPTYLDFIGVMMTTVTVVLTALAIGISVVAISTFREIEQKVQRAVNKKIDENVHEKRIRKIVNDIIFAGSKLEQQESDNEQDTSANNSNGNQE